MLEALLVYLVLDYTWYTGVGYAINTLGCRTGGVYSSRSDRSPRTTAARSIALNPLVTVPRVGVVHHATTLACFNVCAV